MDDATPTPKPPPTAALRVLASGSSGNCSVLLVKACGQRRICLIDAGISPRRTRRLLERSGLSLDMLDAVLVTHLDHDHWRHAWTRALPSGAVVHLHRRHAAAAKRDGVLPECAAPFDGAFDLYPGIRVEPIRGAHDDLGVTAFRFDFAVESGTASLGFATDLGHVPDSLIDRMRGVDVLAIESNYCPRMQQASERPWFLKRRIMGGSGHLSNEQCARAVGQIAPRSHVVLLHLSRECNHPELALQPHAGAAYELTVTHHERPSRWVPVRPTPRASLPPLPPVQLSLFGSPQLDGALPGASTAAHG
jgi:phosphoribosyl 1,2-cyclic phosphodiesterase